MQTDLTGDSCTSGSEREFTLEGSWLAFGLGFVICAGPGNRWKSPSPLIRRGTRPNRRRNVRGSLIAAFQALLLKSE